MILPIKDKKRKRRTKGMQPKPQWAEAFMVLLLAKAGGSVSMSVERLEAFGKVKGYGNATNLSYDEDTKMVTLRLPKITMPVRIIAPSKKIITKAN